MRLFVAIELPAELKDQLVALKTEIAGATWVKSDAMHLTLRFLGGDIDPIRLTPIKTALSSVHAPPFSLMLRGTGRFPPGSRKPARVLWVGIVDQPALMRLQAAVEQALTPVGFLPEDRGFNPHITLARLKADDGVDRFLDQHRAFRAESFTVSAFYLVSSLLTPQGPVYRHEASFPLNE